MKNTLLLDTLFKPVAGHFIFYWNPWLIGTVEPRCNDRIKGHQGLAKFGGYNKVL